MLAPVAEEPREERRGELWLTAAAFVFRANRSN